MIYLDNSATTKPCTQCVEKVCQLLTTDFGNPSSRHAVGLSASHEVEHARKVIAKELGCDTKEIYFTSGGTEANCTALFGGVYGRKAKGKKKVVLSAIEHSSLFESGKQLESEGFDVHWLKPDKFGNISREEIFSAIDENTVFVSLMLVNNEVGAIEPVKLCRSAITRAKAPALLHCDAVQAFGKIPVKVKSLDVDLLTITAHKIHGPKGVGALFVKKGTHLLPRQFGGEQESKVRPGTEATPLIAGFGAAVEALTPQKDLETVRELNQYLRQKLSAVDCAVLNSDENALPYILNVSFLGVRSETLLNYLSENGVCVSSGSACAKGKASHALEALNIGKERSDSAIRVSFSAENTKSDIDTFVDLATQWVARVK